MLSCYRILDLTTHDAFMCGRALADFGAEVIKIEKPGGDPSRFIGPFYKDEADPEKNLKWFAFNSNKKGITLDIENPEGMEIFKKMVIKSDVVLESFMPGYLDRLGLGYKALSAINPAIVLTSITGFGQEGPYRDYKSPDIVLRALGGLMFMCGYEDRPPLAPTYQHTLSIGATTGAVGTMIALSDRVFTGKGQHVDVPTQQALVVVCSAETEGPWALYREIPSRHGRARATVRVQDNKSFYNPLMWSCKDGDVAFSLNFTPDWARFNAALIGYVKKDGIDIGFLEGWDYDKKGWKDITLEQANELTGTIAKFFLKHTKSELLEIAMQNRFQIGPSNTAADALSYPQLLERGFWKEIEHPELGTSLKYPGGGVTTTGGYCGTRTRAPLIGEHNKEIYQKLLGLTANELKALKAKTII
jgi:benzylsuccinate CoA-transferase BbsE subunit